MTESSSATELAGVLWTMTLQAGAQESALTEVRNVVVANKIRHCPAVQVVLGQALLGETLHRVDAPRAWAAKSNSALTFSWLPE